LQNLIFRNSYCVRSDKEDRATGNYGVFFAIFCEQSLAVIEAICLKGDFTIQFQWSGAKQNLRVLRKIFRSII